MRLRSRAFGFLVAVLALFWAVAPARAAEFGAGTVTVETTSGAHTFDVEVAETASARAIGLMHRAHLADNAGMWFDFERPGPVSMWMKNTLIPLDMFFVAEDGHIVSIETDTTPFSLRVIESGGDVRYVLETNAGVARRIGARPGDMVLFTAD